MPTTVLAPTLPQQLNMHFLATNNTLSAKPLYLTFIGETWPDTGCMHSSALRNSRYVL